MKQARDCIGYMALKSATRNTIYNNKNQKHFSTDDQAEESDRPQQSRTEAHQAPRPNGQETQDSKNRQERQDYKKEY